MEKSMLGRDNGDVQEYLYRLGQGEVCVHPSGGLYGLTFDPTCAQAWRRLREIKRRAFHKGLLFLCSHYADAVRYWQPLPERWQQRLQRVWPAHLSVVWDKAAAAPVASQGEGGPQHFWVQLQHVQTIGLRVPLFDTQTWFEHVLHEFPYPLPTTSINISGHPALTVQSQIQGFAREHRLYCPSSLWQQCNQQLQPAAGTERGAGDKAGPEQENVACASTIMQITGPDEYVILREGVLSAHEVERLLVTTEGGVPSRL